MKYFATIFTMTDFKVRPELIFWLLRLGLKSSQINFVAGNGRSPPVVYNLGVRKAMEQDAERFIFADCDISPSPLTDPVLESQLDICSTACNTECSNSDWDADDFHSGLWTARKETIREIGLPLFRWELNGDETHITKCLCLVLAEKARKLGYTVGNAGVAGHTPRHKVEQESFRINM